MFQPLKNFSRQYNKSVNTRLGTIYRFSSFHVPINDNDKTEVHRAEYSLQRDTR